MNFLKVCFFLRIYDGFSFLVSMMNGVFSDLKFFLSFYMIFLAHFSMQFLIIFQGQYLESYYGVGLTGYILMAFRTSLGDFEVDGYPGLQSYMIIVAWIIWILAVFILNVIFMNFIIAVISESYGKVMQKMVGEGYKVKAEMICERELFFSEDDTKNPIYFPKYLILRRSAEQVDGDQAEWQGFVKDIKLSMKQQQTKIKSDMSQMMKEVGTKIEVQAERVTQMDKKFL